jgi:hypothetical protein
MTSLVDRWDAMTNDERKRTLAGIFDSITASAERIVRMEPCEDWRPYLIAAIPSPVGLSAERKTGLYVPDVETPRLVRDERGWLRLAG